MCGLSAGTSNSPVQKLLPLVVSMHRSEALDAGGHVRQEGRLRDVVQALQLPNEDARDDVQHREENDQGAHRYQEPGEHAADDAQAEEDQDHILDEHLCLEREAGVHWGGTGGCQSTRETSGWADRRKLRDGRPATFIHVLGETVEDAGCWRRVEEFHGAA